MFKVCISKESTIEQGETSNMVLKQVTSAWVETWVNIPNEATNRAQRISSS